MIDAVIESVDVVYVTWHDLVVCALGICVLLIVCWCIDKLLP